MATEENVNDRSYEEYCMGLRLVGKIEEEIGLGVVQGTVSVLALKNEIKKENETLGTVNVVRSANLAQQLMNTRKSKAASSKPTSLT